MDPEAVGFYGMNYGTRFSDPEWVAPDEESEILLDCIMSGAIAPEVDG